MNNYLKGLSALALVGSMTLTGCGGGGSTVASSIPNTPTKAVAPTTKATAVQKVTMNVPMFKVASLSKTTPSAKARKPQYVSPDTSNITLMLDSALAVKIPVTGISSNPNGAVVTVLPKVFDAANESYSYTTTAYTNANGAAYYQIALTLDLLPGSHEVGVVLTDNTGFVLSEGQSTYLLNPGKNNDATLALQAVAASAFIVDKNLDPTGLGPMDSDGTYHEVAFLADNYGDIIFSQVLGASSPLTIANGPWTVAESDGKNVLTINSDTQSLSFADPGQAYDVYSTTEVTPASGYTGFAGHNLTIKCNKVNTSATISVQVGSSTKGIVDGFDYTNHWTAAGQYINVSSPLAAQGITDQGNTMTFNCDANFNLTIQ